MRKVTVFVSFMIFSLAVVASAQTHPTYFQSKEQCQTALASGNFTPYTPKFFGLKGVNQVNNTTTKLAPIEANACVYMLTTNGKQWVVQLDGTVFRWNVNADGSLGKPYALESCGNPADQIAYVPAPPPLAPLPVVVPAPAVPVITPQPTATATAVVNVEVGEEEEEDFRVTERERRGMSGKEKAGWLTAIFTFIAGIGERLCWWDLVPWL